MLLTTIPWAARVWALPFLTALAPSERYCTEHQHRRKHKKITDWTRQIILLLCRWLKGRKVVIITDSSYSALEDVATQWTKVIIPQRYSQKDKETAAGQRDCGVVSQ